jgi:hypothetical protein
MPKSLNWTHYPILSFHAAYQENVRNKHCDSLRDVGQQFLEISIFFYYGTFNC